MKGFIFAAGIGSRLRPITDTIPKALVEVGGEPVIAHTLLRFMQSGINEATVNVHHHSHLLKKYLTSFAHENPIRINISDESDRLRDTGGGLLFATKHISPDEPLLVHNADIISGIDLQALLNAHILSGADITLAVQPVRKSSRRLLFDAVGRMRGWLNTADGETRPHIEKPDLLRSCAFSGIWVANPTALLPRLKDYAAKYGNVFSITHFFIENADKLRIFMYEVPENTPWFDIGRLDNLEKARKFFNERENSLAETE